MFPTEDAARAEFHRLCGLRDDAMAKAKPHRDAYDRKRAQINEMEARELTPLEDTMRAAEDGLFDLNQKIGQLSRFLRGQVGEPDDASPSA